MDRFLLPGLPQLVACNRKKAAFMFILRRTYNALRGVIYNQSIGEIEDGNLFHGCLEEIIEDLAVRFLP